MARIVIVGAGVGGLCAAHAVEQSGHEPIVLERMTGSSAVGAGLVLWPNAVRALDRLGLGEAVRGIAVNAREARFSTARGRRIATIDVATIVRRAGLPMLLVERGELHRVLAAGLSVRLAAEVVAVEESGVMLADGDTVAADAVIGADGIGSTVRAAVAPDCSPRDTGFTAIRGVAARAIEDGVALEAWGRRELIGAAPLADGRTYWFYEAPSRSLDPTEPLAAVAAERWPKPFEALVAATDPASLLVNRVGTLPRLRDWNRGAVALLGDAAHAMAPNLGQGAAQAIEDAAALNTALSRHDDLPRALAEYANTRRRRAGRIQRESGRAARLALSPLAPLRNLAVQAVPGRLRVRALERLLID